MSGHRRSLRPSAAEEIVERWIAEATAMLDELEETCALDVADRGQLLGPTELGRLLGVTKQRMSQELDQYEPRLRARLEINR